MAAMSLSERLRQAADRCCQDEGFEAMEVSSRAFLDLLESPLHDLELKKASPVNWLTECEQALQQAGELLDPSASSGLVLCEKIGLELPRVVVKFVSLSQACQDHCLSIVEALAENCSPREMFTAFMEALNMYTSPQTLICCIPLVQGLSLAFSRLQRRQARFFQEASLGLLTLVRLTAQDEGDDEVEEEETSIETVQGMHGENIVPLELVHAAIMENIVQLAQVVRETCDAVDVEEQREDFQRRLGMFTLQILGITGEKIARPEWEVPASVMELVALLPLCDLSISLLLTKNQIEVLVRKTSDDVTGDAYQTAQNDQRKIEATKGAALAELLHVVPRGHSEWILGILKERIIIEAYWTLSNNQGAEAAKVTLNSIREGIQTTGRTGIVSALSVASSLLTGRSSRPLSSVPAFGLTLVETVLKLASSLEFSSADEEDDGCLTLTLQILPALQRLQNVVVYAPSVEMRRQGYAALRKVIQEVLPPTVRLQCLQMLINNCLFPSLVSLHLICMRDEVDKAWPSSPHQQGQPRTNSTDVHSIREGPKIEHVPSPFLSKDILEAIGNILRPGTGAPPDLPAQIDSVQSALNLYRFILIRESSGKTNYTEVLSKEALTRARLQWLLPLRELVEGVSLGLAMEDSEMSADMSLAIDALQSVLYRCLELNEEALARC